MNNLQKENRIYDALLIWSPTTNCNLNCAYCITKNTMKEMPVISEKIFEINISALIKTLNKTGKTFRIDFMGGEPFLIPNIIEACMEITKNHYISFFTNLTSEKIKEFCEKIDPERIFMIIASLHVKELEKFNLLDKYINNYHLCKKKGFNISANEVAYPPFLDEIEKYKKYFQEKGIDLFFKAFIGKYNGKNYPASYTKHELKSFGLAKIHRTIFCKKGKLCNAGYNASVVYPNGTAHYCASIHKKIGNVYEKIKFKDKLIRCPIDFCTCPLNLYDPYLISKAIKETKLNKAVNPSLKTEE